MIIGNLLSQRRFWWNVIDVQTALELNRTFPPIKKLLRHSESLQVRFTFMSSFIEEHQRMYSEKYNKMGTSRQYLLYRVSHKCWLPGKSIRTGSRQNWLLQLWIEHRKNQEEFSELVKFIVRTGCDSVEFLAVIWCFDWFLNAKFVIDTHEKVAQMIRARN